MLRAIKIKDGWIICGKCGHKLARNLGIEGSAQIEFKCPVCKEVNLYKCDDTKTVKTNRKWLESLSDEDLADVINKHDVCVDCKKFYKKSEWEACNIEKCNKSFVHWLQTEHKESEK